MVTFKRDAHKRIITYRKGSQYHSSKTREDGASLSYWCQWDAKVHSCFCFSGHLPEMICESFWNPKEWQVTLGPITLLVSGKPIYNHRALISVMPHHPHLSSQREEFLVLELLPESLPVTIPWNKSVNILWPLFWPGIFPMSCLQRFCLSSAPSKQQWYIFSTLIRRTLPHSFSVPTPLYYPKCIILALGAPVTRGNIMSKCKDLSWIETEKKYARSKVT